ncbi:alpha,alpha-phosphotrehalase [Rothia sp. (in: high G+C Gram-positive bacteria)]|uniref:alpha,alpha-phosphotrehalase n=1 Tax=Rothia sp. (in: high G+C Gram-positive bacteria) TaxID=1885016 RepID=UPI000EC3F999|nr:alpha,alpha-phosphotrehalase [Rothia sp. (in: high G+C Gram-positive bacteria)]
MSMRNAVIYQIYPKSFYDSTGSGTGDLRGIIEKVPYITSLGVDMVWFNPFFISPQNDNGYDIADYYNIDPTMGSMADVEELIAALTAGGVGVMFDMVLNHVSIEHEWFQRALAGEQEYQNFFYLRPLQEDGSLPTNWESKFGGKSWSQFGETDLYYLHLYDTTQADLNWHNPRVRQELFKVVNFWAEKGVRGFRFDVLNVIGKDTVLHDAAPGENDKLLYTDTERVHPWVQELNRETFGSLEGAITVGEMSSTTIKSSVRYTNPANRELDMVFSFHHLKVDYVDGQKWSDTPFRFMELKQLLTDWAVGIQAGGGWQASFFNNHDQPRALNRFGDAGIYRVQSAQMLAAATHLTRGTPFIYMGEEIGMTDPVYESMDDYVDIESHNAYKILCNEGVDPADAFEIITKKSRDNSRTPMQWTSGANAGFTLGKPWLRPTSHAEINVEAEEREGQILPFYRRLIQLRHDMPLIAEGTYEPFAREHESVYAFVREHEGQRLLVLNNFYGTETSLKIPVAFAAGSVLLSNYGQTELGETLTLAPYQTLAILADEKAA